MIKKKKLLLFVPLFFLLIVTSKADIITPGNYWIRPLNFIMSDEYLLGYAQLENDFIYLTFNKTSSYLKAYQYRPASNTVIQAIQDTQTLSITTDHVRCYKIDNTSSSISFICGFAYTGNMTYLTYVNITLSGYLIDTILHTTPTYSPMYLDTPLYGFNNEYGSYKQPVSGLNRTTSIISVLNKTSFYNLTIPSVFTQVFEGLVYEMPSIDKIFVFVIANHPSYPGNYYLYELIYSYSTRSYLDLRTLYTGGNLAYLGAYFDPSEVSTRVLKLYALDFTGGVYKWYIFDTHLKYDYDYYVAIDSYNEGKFSHPHFTVYSGYATVSYTYTTPNAGWEYPTGTGLTQCNSNITVSNETYAVNYTIGDRINTSVFPLGKNITVHYDCGPSGVGITINTSISPALYGKSTDFPIILPNRFIFVEYVRHKNSFSDTTTRGYLLDSFIYPGVAYGNVTVFVYDLTTGNCTYFSQGNEVVLTNIGTGIEYRYGITDNATYWVDNICMVSLPYPPYQEYYGAYGYNFSNIPAGTYRISVTRSGYSTESYTYGEIFILDANESKYISANLRLKSVYDITINVQNVYTGESLSFGATLYYSNGTVYPGTSGTYYGKVIYKYIPNGTYYFTVTSDGYYRYTSPRFYLDTDKTFNVRLFPTTEKIILSGPSQAYISDDVTIGIYSEGVRLPISVILMVNNKYWRDSIGGPLQCISFALYNETQNFTIEAKWDCLKEGMNDVYLDAESFESTHLAINVLAIRPGYNISQVIPVPPEYSPMVSFFLTPLFLSSLAVIGLAGYVEYKVKSNGVAFLVICLVGIILLGFFGVYPIWVTVLLFILAAAIGAYFIRKQYGGG